MDLDKVNFDNEVLAYLSVRKDELIESHEAYIHEHPEIREVLNDFLSSILLHKPVSYISKVYSNFRIFDQDDVYVYGKEYFHPFNPTPLRGKPFILVGPSGVGKNTLVQEVLKKYEGIFEKKVSYTTRPSKGDKEKAGKNYYLITKEQFQKVSVHKSLTLSCLYFQKIQNKDFVEYREIAGHYYGTCKKEL